MRNHEIRYSGIESVRLKERFLEKTKTILFKLFMVNYITWSILTISPQVLASRVKLKVASQEMPVGLDDYSFPSQETKWILEAMTGRFNPALLEEIQSIVGYTLPPLDSTISSDKALEASIVEMYRRYPSLLELNKRGPRYGRNDESAKFEFLTCSVDMYGIMLERLCGVEGADFYKELQRILLLTWLSELPHIKQMQDGDLFLHYIEDMIRIGLPTRLGGYDADELSDLYTIENTAERIAHHIYEPQMQKLFLQFYERNADMRDRKSLLFVAKMLNGGFYLTPVGPNGKKVVSTYYEDPEKASFYYNESLQLEEQ